MMPMMMMMMNSDKVKMLYSVNFLTTNGQSVCIEKDEILTFKANYNDEWCWVERFDTDYYYYSYDYYNHHCQYQPPIVSASDRHKKRKQRKRKSKHNKSKQNSINGTFLVPVSFISPVAQDDSVNCFNVQLHNCDSNCQRHKSMMNDNDYDDDDDDPEMEKKSDEAIGSSRDSLDVVNSIYDCVPYEHIDQHTFSCDNEPVGLGDHDDNDDGYRRLDNKLSGEYAEPGQICAKPRQNIKPLPLYANLVVEDNQSKNRIQNTTKPPPIPNEFGAQMKRVLFDNWIEYENDSGRKFYHNYESGLTSWKPPRRLTTKVDTSVVNAAAAGVHLDEISSSSSSDQNHHRPPIDQQLYHSYDSSTNTSSSSNSSNTNNNSNHHHHHNQKSSNKSPDIINQQSDKKTDGVKRIVQIFNENNIQPFLMPSTSTNTRFKIDSANCCTDNDDGDVDNDDDNSGIRNLDRSIIKPTTTTDVGDCGDYVHNPLMTISKLLNSCPPDGWYRYINSQTGEIYCVNKANNIKWFCKQDENGRIYFYEENVPNVGVFADLDSGGGGDGSSSNQQQTVNKSEQQNFNQENSQQESNNTTGRMSNERNLRSSNTDRSIKAHSMVAMLNTDNTKSSEIMFNEKFKHSSPFQSVAIVFPPPPSSLNMKDIVYSGNLNRTRTVISGKAKRKNWGTSHVILTQYYLLFFKDKKSAFMTPTTKPEFVFGLLNATIDWCMNESSRKNCFKISTFQDQMLLQEENSDRSSKWYSNINACISKLPSPFNPPSTMDANLVEAKYGGIKLKRSRSTKQYRPNEDYKIQGSNTLSGYATISNTPTNDKKIKIRERLRQFLRKRPTMESLREKGIIKDENVFGCTLELLCAKDQSMVPKFVRKCVETIEIKDLKADGIYRACGNLSSVQKLRFEINQDNYQGLAKEDDVHVLTGLLKMFFRDMKEPLFPCDRVEQLMKFIAIKDKQVQIESFRTLVHELPEPNYQTLKYVLQHLLRVTNYSQENRMHIQNLSIVFGPTLIRPIDDLNNLMMDMMLQMQQSRVVEFLLQEYELIF